MSNLTNFNNFELNTEETTNVEGGWGCRRRRRRTSYSSYNTCYSSYNTCDRSYSYNNCEPAAETVEVAPVEEIKIEVAPVVEAPAAPVFRGVQGA